MHLYLLRLSVLLAWALPAAAWAQGFTYATIADNSAGSYFDGVGGAPGINDAGTVVFAASYGSTGQGIFTSTGGDPTAVFTLDTRLSDGSPTGLVGFGSNPSINNAGTVALLGQQGAGYFSIVVASSGSLQRYNYLQDLTLNLATTNLRINAQGEDVMTTSSVFNSNSKAIVNSAGSVVFLTDSGIQSLSVGPAINDSGVVVAIGQDNDGVKAIYTRTITLVDYTGAVTDGPITPVITSTNSAFSSFIRSTIDNNGKIIFEATPTTGGTGVYTLQDGVVSTLASTSDGTFRSFGSLSCNNEGAVAFQCQLTSGGGAIYLSLDGQLTRLVGVGDDLFGSTVQNIAMGMDALNDNGQVAFSYLLTNGTTGIAVASPVPEPATVGLGGLGLCVLLFRRLRV